jgi:hypothetical protein
VQSVRSWSPLHHLREGYELRAGVLRDLSSSDDRPRRDAPALGGCGRVGHAREGWGAMTDTTDPGAALLSRVQEARKAVGMLQDVVRRCGMSLRDRDALVGAIHLALDDLASALQQTQATCEALSNLCADRQAHLAAVSSALQQTQAENQKLKARASRLEDAALLRGEE